LQHYQQRVPVPCGNRIGLPRQLQNGDMLPALEHNVSSFELCKVTINQ
jgi:hypothetical protein